MRVPWLSKRHAVLLCSMMFACCVLTGFVDAQQSTPHGTTPFAITRHVIASGGGTSSNGTFAIAGTIGQADADPLQPSSDGDFAIIGGFWPATSGVSTADLIFRNGFEVTTP